ncbi:START domain-containing protein [Vibrio sp. VB16]|uniref:START domain-containing protein n=1 Tax=Vibrio sp. VB16 TaxID=2785746 RepID=UPI00189D8526|nr:START domain-containing protein [Vibrio sp. VB16]UGA57754.1 START domain-containing protein [Vibrio sp. VB16]
MHSRVGLIWLILLSLLPASNVLAEEPWQPVLTDNDIIIHKRERQIGLIEIRAQMVTMTSLEACMRILSDAESVSKWVAHAKEATILKRISPNEYLVQTIFSAPWPTSNRDMITYSTISQPDKNTLILTVKDAHQSLPKQTGLVRMTDVQANWTVQKLSNGMTHISYTAYANPNGIIPVWLANELTIGSVSATFQNLKKRLPLYQ